MKRWLQILWVLGWAGAAAAQTSAVARGIGPAVVELTTGRTEGRLLKCDATTLWIGRSEASGRSFEVGIPLAEVRRIELPAPSAFILADTAATAEQIKAAHESLDRLMIAMKPFAALPGIPMDVAYLKKGMLFHKEGRWLDAVRQFEAAISATTNAALRNQARIRAGIASELAGRAEAALRYLREATPPDDDEELLSTMLFSRASAARATGQHEAALMDFLKLVVFLPYLHNNELRGLEGAAECYVALKDWDALQKTAQWMAAEYPTARETKHVQEMVASHAVEMQKEGIEASRSQPVSSEAEQRTPQKSVEDLKVD